MRTGDFGHVHYNPAQPCPQGTAALVEFTPGDVPGRYQDLIQRLAVLVPLFGTEAVEPEPVPRLTLKLVDRWRGRVMELAEAGLPGLAGDDAKAWQARKYAMNCLPTFAIVPQRTRCCRLREICPFCWAREVRETWMKIDRAFFAPTGGKGPSAFDMVEVGRDVPLPLRVNSDRYGRVLPEGESIEALPEYFAGWAASRHGLIKKSEGLLASFQTIHIGFEGGRWVVGHRSILMIDHRGVSYGPKDHSQFRYFRHHGRPDRRTVMHAVAGACRYPTFLLRGDAGLVVRYLGARKKRKLSAMTGTFRNGKARDVVPEPAPLT